MNEYTRDTQVEDVIDAYLAAAAGPDWSTLLAWIERYPQFERELTDFAVAWSQTEALPEPPALTAPATEQWVQRRLGEVRGLLGSETAATALHSLVDAGKARGLTPRQLATRLNLSSVLLAQLDRRLIRYASIPAALIDGVAQVLQRERGAVQAYLQGGATFAAGAQFKADQPPMLAAPQTFADAVRADPALSAEQRRAWLALAQQDGDGADDR